MTTYAGAQEAMDVACVGDIELATEALSQALDMIDRLTGELTSIRSLYRQATHNHPDDEVRKLALDHSQALIDDTFEWTYVKFEMED